MFVAGLLAASASVLAAAQGPGRGNQPPKSPREGAPVDLTGYWVSLVTEDWRWRMVTPLKGDSASIPINQAAKKGLLAATEARRKAKIASKVPLDRVPVLRITAMALAQQRFAPEEGFVLSRINGQWDVRSILKLCPMSDEETLLIFSRLLDRGVIALG